MNVDAIIKQGPDFKYGEILVPNPDGSYVDWIHLHGNTFNNAPNILNASTNGPLLMQQTPWLAAGPPVKYFAVDPIPGFRYLIPISDTPVPESTPDELEKFLLFVGYKSGIISAHSYGVSRMMAYFASPIRTFDFQAALSISGYNDGSVKSLPKLNFLITFHHAQDDKIVSVNSTKNYLSMLQAAGNKTIPFVADLGGNHDLGRIWMNGVKQPETFKWVASQLAPVVVPTRVGIKDVWKDKANPNVAHILWQDNSVDTVMLTPE